MGTVTLEAVRITAGFGAEPSLRDASLTVATGEAVAVMGASGSGKSTLLFCLAGLLRPAEGRVLYDGTDIYSLGERDRSLFRLREFGFVFQFGDLVPELTAVENVALPLRFAGVDARRARERAIHALEALGVDGVAGRRTSDVSGGELQRVAVARALVHDPKIVFADEPTGALDEENGALVLESFLDAARVGGAGVVLVTHDPDVAGRADRLLQIRNGSLHEAQAA